MSVNHSIEFDTSSPKLCCDEGQISAWVYTHNTDKENACPRVVNQLTLKPSHPRHNRLHQLKPKNINHFQKYNTPYFQVIDGLSFTKYRNRLEHRINYKLSINQIDTPQLFSARYAPTQQHSCLLKGKSKLLECKLKTQIVNRSKQILKSQRNAAQKISTGKNIKQKSVSLPKML